MRGEKMSLREKPKVKSVAQFLVLRVPDFLKETFFFLVFFVPSKHF